MKNNKIKRGDIKATILGIAKINANKGYLLLLLICILAFILFWKYTYNIHGLEFISYIEDRYNIVKTIVDIALFVLPFLIIWIVIIVIGKNNAGIYDNGFIEQNFMNYTKNPPDLICKKRNSKEVKHSYKWLFLANNMTLEYWKDNYSKVEQVLDIYSNYIEYSDRTKKIIVVKGVPTSKHKPLLLNTKDKLISNEKNCVIVGGTGSGKSYAMWECMGQVAINNDKNTCIFLCDPKGDDENFMQYDGCPNYYLGIDNVVNGIDKFYHEFKCRRDITNKQLKQQRKKQIIYLFLDEYSMLLSSLDKNTSDRIKTQIGELLRVGRSLNCRVFLGLQNAYSEFFDKSRDNLSLRIALGTISKEEKSMMFDRYKDKMTREFGRGEGYIYRSGIGIDELKVAKIEDTTKIDNIIKKALSNEIIVNQNSN